MPFVKKIRFKNIIFWSFLALLLQACGKSETFANLEEQQSILGENAKAIPLLTRVKDREVNAGESLSLNFNNEKTGSDAGMKYACIFDNTIDGSFQAAKDCDQLPDEPSAKFDTATGVLSWGPITSLGSYKFQVTGANAKGKEAVVFTITVIENKIPALVKIHDQSTDANRLLSFTAVNKNASTNIESIFTCYFDTKVNESVAETTNCDSLPGGSAKKFDPNTGVFTWTPANQAVGVYELLIKVTNSLGVSQQIFTLTVNPDPNLPVLTKVAAIVDVFVGETLSYDFKNEKTGNDEAMTYSCTYDTLIDGAVPGTNNCNNLPDLPTSKFSPTKGTFVFGPLATVGNYEILIKGQNAAGIDEALFVVHVKDRDSPRLARLLDKQIEATQTLLVTPTNQNALRGDLVTYACTFDAVIDGQVVNGNLCINMNINDPNTGGGNGGPLGAVVLNTLVLTAYDQSGTAVFSAHLADAVTLREATANGNGTGKSDFTFALNSDAAAALAAAIAANPNLRLGLSASVDNAQGGHESFFFCPNCNGPQATPEPTTMILLGTGLAGFAGAIRKRRNAAKTE